MLELKTFEHFNKRYASILKEIDEMPTYKKNTVTVNYIYFLQNTITRDIYIGRSKYNVEYRFKQHIQKSKHKKSDTYNNPLPIAIREYGENNFNIGYIDCILSHKDCYIEPNKLEQKYIKKFQTLYPNGYNISGLKGLKLKQYRFKGINNG